MAAKVFYRPISKTGCFWGTARRLSLWGAEPPTSYIYNCHDITFLTKIWEKSFFFVGGSGVDGNLVVTAPWGGGGVAGAGHGWAGEFLHFFG